VNTLRQSNGLYWIETRTPGRLAILRRPRSAEALDDVVADWLGAGIDSVVCLLADDERRDLGLDREAAACREAGLAFIEFPIEDFGVPTSTARIVPVLQRIVTALRQGGSVGIHCNQSVGRSGLLASCVLVALGFEPVEAFHVISKSRGTTVPETSEQRRWIEAAKPALRALPF
jgi:protein-tyrosine phosphatase